MDEPMNGPNMKLANIAGLQSEINGYLIQIAILQEKIAILQNEIAVIQASD